MKRRNKRYDSTFWGSAAVLWLFWIVVTGSLHYQQLLLGLLVVLGVSWFNNDLFFRRDERVLLETRAALLYLRYGLHLFKAIILANIQVAVLVLDPRMPISPGMVRFGSPMKTGLHKTILANSISLTPGTLTVLVEEEEFMVHALTRKNAEEVVTWELAEELAKIEAADENASADAPF